MTAPMHPDAVLYAEVGTLPQIPAIEHFAGSEKLMRKAMAIQAERGPVFDITFDCEDGARAGDEQVHAELIAALLMSADNRFNRIGARIHDLTHAAWKQDLELIVGLAGWRLAYLSFPKARNVSDVERVLAALREVEARAGLKRQIPLHAIIETHGAVRQAWQIAALPGVETLDFGLMDFVSAHLVHEEPRPVRSSPARPRQGRDFGRRARPRGRALAQRQRRVRGSGPGRSRRPPRARGIRLPTYVEHPSGADRPHPTRDAPQ